MNRTLNLYIIFALLFFAISQPAMAQIPGQNSFKVSQLSDKQIIQLWQRAQKSGMSENEAIEELVKRGLSATDVNQFKQRLIQVQSSNKSSFSTQNSIRDTAGFLRDSSWILAVPQVKKISPYFGFEFFSNPNISFEPNIMMAPPKSYVLGAGDELSVTVTGANETDFTNTISKEGNFLLPYAGLVNLNGLSLEQATQKIKQKLKTAYPLIGSGKTQVMVTVDNVKSMQIHVIGEAEKPGTYTLSSIANLFNVLYVSGGPSANGSLRNIELIRNNAVIATIDFYEFLLKGTLSKSLQLENQDIVRFPVYQKRVSVNGQIKRAAIYELQEKETLQDLIVMAGGMGDTAYKESVKVVQLSNKERLLRDVAAADFAYFIPRNADSVYIEKVPSIYNNKIILAGAVNRPGNYELTKDFSLVKLIQKANGILEKAYTNRAAIFRRNPVTYEQSIISFEVSDVLSGKSSDILLAKDDSIHIYAKDLIEEKSTITVGGNVRNPGTFSFKKGISVEDAILLAGGFTNDAATHKVEISRLEKNKSDTLANKLIDLIKVEVDSSLSKRLGSQALLEPLDYIFVPRLLNYRNLGGVKVRGEVLYSGDYSLERRDETVQEIIKRAGGVTPNGSFANAQVYRNKLRVATTILNENEMGSENRFLLLPGDSIHIPRNESFVEVQGQVFNQQIFAFESRRFKSYISDAGGITDKGNLRKSYIQYSNGVNKKIKNFLFVRIYPKVQPGSKIIVPEINPAEKKGLTVFELSALTGILTAIVGMVSVLRR